MISFGHFLIKQVVEDLARKLPSLKTFVTLSPVPTYARWLDRVLGDEHDGTAGEADRLALEMLEDPGWVDDDEEKQTAVQSALMPLAAHYFLRAKTAQGRPVDPVARFHLGNGARLERLNWLGDVSEKGLREAHGLMVNYCYELKDIERNHEAYVNSGEVIVSRSVRGLLRAEVSAPTGIKIRKAVEVIGDKDSKLLSNENGAAQLLPPVGADTAADSKT